MKIKTPKIEKKVATCKCYGTIINHAMIIKRWQAGRYRLKHFNVSTGIQEGTIVAGCWGVKMTAKKI